MARYYEEDYNYDDRSRPRRDPVDVSAYVQDNLRRQRISRNLNKTQAIRVPDEFKDVGSMVYKDTLREYRSSGSGRSRGGDDDYDEALYRREYNRRRRARDERRRRQRLIAYRNRAIALFVLIMLIVLLVLGIRALVGFIGGLLKDSDEEISLESSVEMGKLYDSGGNILLADLNRAEGGSIDDVLQPINTDYSLELSEPMPEPSDRTYSYEMNGSTVSLSSDKVESDYAILVDCDTGVIIADRRSGERMVPASMTKILTLLVAAEHIRDTSQLEDTVTLDAASSNYIYKNDSSVVGFELEEEIPVRDLFYGTILKSGADAAIMLANYVAGSHEAFVEMMNEKCRELGIGATSHFTNCIGLYDDELYSTMRDMAVILNAAMDNEFCREVLGRRKYTTVSTPQHPEGIEVSNLFLRRIEDKDTGGEVKGAKTGFVNQSKNCAASYYTSADGRNMICVTAGGNSNWRCIYDHVAIYNIYGIGNTEYERGS